MIRTKRKKKENDIYKITCLDYIVAKGTEYVLRTPAQVPKVE